ncbi:hypothetical protein OH76DRAFT_1039839 [Lentinus brumalis]|uniref:Uncharacterized protein n=1 Tax=Lentinus brumalis TaxID=2498619 RepID=A0A371CWY9_9APHY|nr:hypothetical protein OH76DRAFT_1039839 [Polyporus brumalis]
MSRKNLLGTVECVSEFLADLREHLNAFTPIHRLPPDLLALIFAVVTHIPHRHQDIFNFIEVEVEDEDEERWEYTRARLPSSGVVTITHVCKRWRTVALHTPGLWTQVTALPGSDQFLAYSERSLSLSLSMSVGADTPHPEESHQSAHVFAVSTWRSIVRRSRLASIHPSCASKRHPCSARRLCFLWNM